MNKMKFLLLAGIFCLLGVNNANAQMLGIKTNLLSDALGAPSLGFEIVTGEHTSFDIQASTTLKKPWGKDVEVTMIQPELRLWYAGRPMTRGFIGFAATLAQYDVTWKSTTHDGYTAGLGINFGYVFHLSKRMNLEANAGVGVYGTHERQYRVGAYNGDYRNDIRMLPSKVGVSIVYILK